MPWGKIEKPEPVNLKDIMSEQLAKELQTKNDEDVALRVHRNLNGNIEQENVIKVEENFVEENASSPEACFADIDHNCDNDSVIAALLQQDYDRCYDKHLERSEQVLNAKSKINISYSLYKRSPLECSSDSEDEGEVIDPRDQKDWDRFDSVNRHFSNMPPCGYKIQGDGSMLTKHDINMSGRRNACKLMSFPPEYETGDSAAFDMKLSNKVYNGLKLFSRHEHQKEIKHLDRKDEQATVSHVLDGVSGDVIRKLLNTVQILDSISGIIKTGKESSVFLAKGNVNSPTCPVPKHCCVKIYKTVLSKYKQRDQYIKDDQRFRDRVGNQPTHKIVHLWAEKEMANLMRLKKAGVPAPDVVYLKKHLLIMKLVGTDGIPAPRLKIAPHKPEDLELAYHQMVQIMKDMYNKANLIHADLSEYNILWHDDQCYVIDVSQAVEPNHENSFDFLLRDCRNMSRFFSKKGVHEVMSPEELFKEITSCDFEDTKALLNLRGIKKSKPHHANSNEPEESTNFETIIENLNQITVPENSINETHPTLVEPVKS